MCVRVCVCVCVYVCVCVCVCDLVGVLGLLRGGGECGAQLYGQLPDVHKRVLVRHAVHTQRQFEKHTETQRHRHTDTNGVRC